jgi:beta-glucosidase/6-phospho-beta-glucosidase/beta-galactosidase
MTLFKSFFIGGFECSTHYNRQRRRLDLLAATGHDRFAELDYARLQKYGIYTSREGIRWHRIETTPGHYTFGDTLHLVRAAEKMGIQVIWDLLHFGYPDDVDPFHPSFIKRFAAFAREFARLLKSETDTIPFITPINEISFLAFQGGEIGNVNPFTFERGHALKAQLVRATIEGMEAIWEIAPNARFVTAEPLFNTVADTEHPRQIARAQAYSNARYQAWDMLAGYLHPELGGAQKYLDIMGVDYYPWNQWIYVNDHEAGKSLQGDDPRYIPLHQLLAQVYERYKRPLLITETSTEGDARPGWLAYVSNQVQLALQSRVPLEGLCWYPIVDFPGWDNERPCDTGLWSICDEKGARSIYEPLAREFTHQSALIQDVQKSLHFTG